MKTLNIVFAVLTKGSLQDQVLDGLKKTLEKKHPGLFKITFISAAGPYKETLAENIRLCLPETHVVITVGVLATIAAREATGTVALPPPIIYTGIHDPIGIGLFKAFDAPPRGMTGIQLGSFPEVFPVQLVHKLMPRCRSFFLPYRSSAQNGRIEFEVGKLKEYFRTHDSVVHTFEIHGDDKLAGLPVQAEEMIRKSEAVILPAQGLYASDATLVAHIAQNENKVIFGRSEDSLREGAIIGFKTDLEFAGVKAAEYAIKLAVENVLVADLPIYHLSPNRRIVTNPEAMAAHGVSFTEDILSTHEHAESWPEIPVKEFGKLVSYKSEFDINLNSAITKRSHADEQAVYFSQMITGVVHDAEWQDAQTDFALDSKLQLHYCIGKKLSEQLVQKMHQRNEHLPIVRTMTKLEAEEETGIKTEPPVAPMSTIILPDPDPLMPLKLLLMFRPNMKKIGLLCHIPERHLTQRYRDRFEKVKAFAQEKEVDLDIVHRETTIDLIEDLPNIADSYEGIFFYEDTCHESIPRWFAGNFRKHSVLVCAGTTKFLDRLPLCYGMDKMAIQEKLFAPVKAVLEHNEPMTEDTVIDYEECYRLNVNAKVCKRYGVSVPSHLLDVLETHLIVTHEEEDNFKGIKHEKNVVPAV